MNAMRHLFAGNRLLLLAAAVLAIAALGLSQGRFGSAHSEMERSEPPAGSTVVTAPTQVVAYFSQELDASGTTMSVLGPNGARVDLGDAAVDLCDPTRKRVTVSLPANLLNGEYTVEWKTFSLEDSEEGSGAFTFVVNVPGGASAASPSASPAASPAASPVASPAASPVASAPSC